MTCDATYAQWPCGLVVRTKPFDGLGASSILAVALFGPGVFLRQLGVLTAFVAV